MKNKRITFYLTFSIVLCLLYIFYGAVLSPISVNVSTNIIYSESYLPFIIGIGFGICQFLIWCHLFAFIIGGYSLYGAMGSVNVLILGSLFTFLRYMAVPLLSFTASSFTYTSGDFTDALLFFLFDLAQMLIALLITHLLSKKRSFNYSAVMCAVMIILVRIGMRIRYDIFYGPPEDLRDLLWMITYYASDIIYGAIAYFVIYFVLKIFIKKKASEN